MTRKSMLSILESPAQAYEIKYFNILSFILQLSNKFLFKFFLSVLFQKKKMLRRFLNPEKAVNERQGQAPPTWTRLRENFHLLRNTKTAPWARVTLWLVCLLAASSNWFKISPAAHTFKASNHWPSFFPLSADPTSRPQLPAPNGH